jgi:hypothetical protein
MDLNTIVCDIKKQGYAFVPALKMRDLFSAEVLAGWASYAGSWNDLAEDTYMADGGRYRKRRHAVFDVTAQAITRKQHQPHYQSLDHNTLNGGIQRWFEPVTPEAGDGRVNMALLDLCRSVFTRAAQDDAPSRYHVEMHQFRIEPNVAAAGKPTPEGVHRDGVDWVCVLLADRLNVNQGVTGIFSPDGQNLGDFTLTTPLDCVFLDDHRVLHGVTPINLVDSSHKGCRDVLVLTFTLRP